MSIQTRSDLRRHIAGVRDQGGRLTCLSNATSVAHECARRSPVALSPEYLHHFASGGRAHAPTRFQEVARALKQDGQPAESDCPYQIAGPVQGWSPPAGLSVFRRVCEDKAVDAAEIESLIDSGYAPILGLAMPQSFFTPATPWVIPPGQPIVSLHAVVGVGIGAYQGKRVVHIQNSWGSTWGDQGYAWIDDAFIAQHVQEVMVVAQEV